TGGRLAVDAGAEPRDSLVRLEVGLLGLRANRGAGVRRRGLLAVGGGGPALGPLAPRVLVGGRLGGRAQRLAAPVATGLTAPVAAALAASLSPSVAQAFAVAVAAAAAAASSAAARQGLERVAGGLLLGFLLVDPGRAAVLGALQDAGDRERLPVVGAFLFHRAVDGRSAEEVLGLVLEEALVV